VGKAKRADHPASRVLRDIDANSSIDVGTLRFAHPWNFGLEFAIEQNTVVKRGAQNAAGVEGGIPPGLGGTRDDVANEVRGPKPVDKLRRSRAVHRL
jgi:hypothetical protein